MVTSPTSRRARAERSAGLLGFRRTGVALALSLALLGGLLPSARAESLDDQRDKVRKEMAQRKKDVAADKAAVASAAKKLADSKVKLAAARSELAGLRTQLKRAKAADADIAAELKTAEAAAASAAAAVARAQGEVDQQESLLGIAIRSAYQQQGTLVSWSMIAGASTPGELAERMQWSNLLFDNTTSELDRLNQLEVSLEQAKAVKDAAEARLQVKRDASATQLSKVSQLTSAADAQAAKVAALVKANAKLKAEAEDELEQSQSEYKKLQQAEAKLSAKIREAERKYNLVNSGGFIRPVNAAAGSGFGMRFHPILHYWRMHWGTDFGAACGSPIRAMADGRVVSAGWTTYGFGNYTIISYGKVKGKYVSSGYAHQSKVLVKAGEKVEQGEVVGYVGTTGLSTGCHLHLQIYQDGVRVNPMKYL